jgi:hypothetical protein
MKKILGIAILAVFLCGCPNTPVVVTPPAPAPTPVDFTIDTNAQFSFTNFPACSASVSKSCVSGFSWGFVVSGVQGAPVKTTPIASFVACPATLPSPPDITCMQPTDSAGNNLMVDFGNSLLPIGGTGATIYWVTNGIDQNGNAVQSSSVTGNSQVLSLAPVVSPSYTTH